VPVHAADTQVRITRPELEAAIEDSLRPTVDELVRTVEAAGLTVADLTAVYLTGGSSRIPRVSELVAERTGLLPTAEGDPKAVVCLGALRAVTDPPPAAPAPSPPVAPEPSPTRAEPSPATVHAEAAEPVTEPMAAGPAAPATGPEPATERFDPVTMPLTPAVPPSPPTASRRPRWLNRGRIVLVSGVALLLAGATATAATALTERNGDPVAEPTTVVTTTTPTPDITTTSPPPAIVAVEPEATTPSPTPENEEEDEPDEEEVEESPTPSARDALSPSQQDLYDKVDLDSLKADTCEEWSPGTAGIDAAIQCDGSGGDLDKQVGVMEFDDNDSMNAYMDGEFTGVTSKGKCSDGKTFKGNWTTEGVVQGRMACYWTTLSDGDDYFKITWSYPDHSIAVSIFDRSATEAGQWWYDHSVLAAE
jgi:molecular chaperone DnaK